MADDLSALRALYAETVGNGLDGKPIYRWAYFDRAAVGKLLEEVQRLTAELDAARAVLRFVEWFGGTHRTRCPYCLAPKNDGHAEGCRLAAALGNAPAPLASAPSRPLT